MCKIAKKKSGSSLSMESVECSLCSLRLGKRERGASSRVISIKTVPRKLAGRTAGARHTHLVGNCPIDGTVGNIQTARMFPVVLFPFKKHQPSPCLFVYPGTLERIAAETWCLCTYVNWILRSTESEEGQFRQRQKQEPIRHKPRRKRRKELGPNKPESCLCLDKEHR